MVLRSRRVPNLCWIPFEKRFMEDIDTTKTNQVYIFQNNNLFFLFLISSNKTTLKITTYKFRLNISHKVG